MPKPATPSTSPSATEILEKLKPLGKESYRRVMIRNHGVQEPCFGVSIGELKKLQKALGTNYQLALDLYETGVYDAMYLAGLIADDARMTRKDLQHWAKKAVGGCLPGTTVPTVAAGSPAGPALAAEWIQDSDPRIASIGWATYSARISVVADADLDLTELRRLLGIVKKSIRSAPDDVRYQMNSFVIAVGCYVATLTDLALETAKAVGPITANLGNNDCQIPDATAYILKVQKLGRLGRKRKSAKC
ncbi:MAG: DNA alkylation repair protein [Verrucomicrobiales bacterium]|nr:DNA alkylation repair protein [Verrucomicrobiales bacterium]